MEECLKISREYNKNMRSTTDKSHQHKTLKPKKMTFLKPKWS